MTVIAGFASPLVATFFAPATVDKAHKAVGQHLIDFAAQDLPEDVHHSLSVYQGHPAQRIVRQAHKRRRA